MFNINSFLVSIAIDVGVVSSSMSVFVVFQNEYIEIYNTNTMEL